MNRVIILSLILLILGLTGITFLMIDNARKNIISVANTKSPVEQEDSTNFTPFTASFKIYTNGTKRDFSSPKYHNLSKDVYITSQNPETIHVQKAGITWHDFFQSLPQPFKLTSTCLTTGTGQNFCMTSDNNLVFYLNKTPSPRLLLDEIQPGDTLTIVFGNDTSITEVLGESTSTPSSILDR